MSQASTSTHKNWLDKIIEDGMLKRYSGSEIKNCTIVGNGGFGLVQKAWLKHTGIAVAMKMLSLSAYTDEQELYKKFVKEVCVYYYHCCHIVNSYQRINRIYVFQLKTHKMVDDHPNVIRCFGLYIGTI